MFSIDLNCDMGESFGAWTMGDDARLMDVVSSINVACGFHAGDASVMRRTIETALAKGVAIGAHPSFPDLQGFGRRSMTLAPAEIFDIVLYQVSALKGMCEALGGKLNHVKPHGALYNCAAKDAETAQAAARAVKAIDAELIFYGLANSFLIVEAEKAGLRTAREVFADRTYQADGSLTDRRQPNAMIETIEKSCAQVLQIIQEGRVTTVGGEKIRLAADTVCIHGDGAHALRFAEAVRAELTKNKIEIKALR